MPAAEHRHNIVLDFGLAKAFVEEDAESGAATSMSPTLTRDATRIGVILGTAAFMSPEQAKGKRVDRRTDVFAFGAVLYEMLTGQRAFAGEDVATTLARVIEREPDWSALPPRVSPVLVAFLRRCLSKDKRQRVHDVADLRLALEGAFDVAAASERAPETGRRTQLFATFVAGIATGLAALAIYSALSAGTTDSTSTDLHLSIALPERFAYVPQTENAHSIVRVDRKGARRPFPALEPGSYMQPRFSPGGTQLAYAQVGGGVWILDLETGVRLRHVHVADFPNRRMTRPVSTEGGTEPLWSPHGRELFYRYGKQVMVVDVDTDGDFEAGAPRMLFEGD